MYHTWKPAIKTIIIIIIIIAISCIFSDVAGKWYSEGPS